MADELNKPSNVAVNVLNRSADASRDVANMNVDALKEAIKRTADISSEAVDSAKEAGEAGVEKVNAAVSDINAQAIETEELAKTAASQVQDKVQDFTQRGSQVLTAYSEAGKQATTAFSELSQVWSEVYKRQLSTYTELSQKALTLRSPQDVIEFNSVAAARAQDQLALIRDAYSRGVTAMTQIWQPIASRREAIAA